MPDIKTALSSALKEWDKPNTTNNTEEKQMQNTIPYGFKITSNVGRRTFAHIKANAGITPQELMAWAKEQGLNPDSAYSTASKATRDGNMGRDANNGFYTIASEYQSPKTGKATKQPKYTPVKKEESKGIKALLAEPKQEPTRRAEPELTNDYILSKLDVRQALSLYRELINIFTGKM